MAWTIRGVALALGVFLFASGVAGLVSPRFDSTIWVLDVRWMTPMPARIVGLVLGVSLAWAGWSDFRRLARPTGLVSGLVLAVLAAINAGTFLVLVFKGEIGSMFPVPASLLVCLVGVAMTLMAWKARGAMAGDRHQWMPSGASSAPTGASRSPRYFCGSPSNFALQPAEQK